MISRRHRLFPPAEVIVFGHLTAEFRALGWRGESRLFNIPPRTTLDGSIHRYSRVLKVKKNPTLHYRNFTNHFIRDNFPLLVAANSHWS